MRFSLIAVALGGTAVIALVGWFGAQAIGADVLRASWAIPITTGLLGMQLWISAVGWRAIIGMGPPLRTWLHIRWIREAVNTLLPVAQLGGNIVGIRMLAHRGVPAALGGAGTTLDVTIEAGTQYLFTVMGFAVLALLDVHSSAWHWAGGALGVGAVAVVGFVLAQRAGLLRLVELLAVRLQRIFPSFSMDAVRGLHAELMRLQRNRRAMAWASFLHLLAWVLGALETWIALTAMGRDVSFAEAFVVESLSMAVRSAGFAVPAGLGVQEGGLILVGGLFGIPPDEALALSMVKRLRELAVGLPGLVAWQWAEGKRLVARRAAEGG